MDKLHACSFTRNTIAREQSYGLSQGLNGRGLVRNYRMLESNSQVLLQISQAHGYKTPVNVKLKPSCTVFCYPVLLHVAIDFISDKYRPIVTLNYKWYSMCGKDPIHLGMMVLADVECTISNSGNCEYASVTTKRYSPVGNGSKNPYAQCAKVLVATKTSEEGLNDFLNCLLDKQYTCLTFVKPDTCRPKQLVS